MPGWIEWIAAAPWFVLVSGLASIASLCISIYVASRVRAIQREMYMRSRVPELLKQLRNVRSTLAKQLNNFDANREGIREILVIASPAIESLKSKFAGDTRRKLVALEKDIALYLGARQPHLWFAWFARGSSHETKEKCRTIYETLLGLIGTAEQQSADYRERLGNVG